MYLIPILLLSKEMGIFSLFSYTACLFSYTDKNKIKIPAKMQRADNLFILIVV